MNRSYEIRRVYLLVTSSLFVLFIGISFVVAPTVEGLAMKIDPSQKFLKPSLTHIMGTDNLGRDLFARTLIGARFTVFVSSVTAIIAFTVGTGLGTIIAFSGKWVDSICMSIVDAVLSFPGILLAILLRFTLGSNLQSLIVALTVIQVPIFVRTMRSAVLSEKHKPYVEAARAIGKHHFSIMRQDIFSNSYLSNVTLVPVFFANAIVTEASLSFLGIGAPRPNISLGTIISDATRFVQTQPHMWLLPTLVIALLLLSVNLLADVAIDRLNR